MGRMGECAARRQPGHVVEHDRNGQPAEQIAGPDELLGRHQQLQMPAELCDPASQRLDLRDRPRHAQRQVEPDAANADAMQRQQIGLAFAAVDDRHAAGLFAHLRQAGEQHPVVGAIGRRRDQHGMAQTQARLQRPVLGDGRIGWQQACPRCGGERAVVDVDMAVAGAGGDLGARRSSPGGEGEGVHGRSRRCWIGSGGAVRQQAAAPCISWRGRRSPSRCAPSGRVRCGSARRTPRVCWSRPPRLGPGSAAGRPAAAAPR